MHNILLGLFALTFCGNLSAALTDIYRKEVEEAPLMKPLREAPAGRTYLPESAPPTVRKFREAFNEKLPAPLPSLTPPPDAVAFGETLADHPDRPHKKQRRKKQQNDAQLEPDSFQETQDEFETVN